MTAAPMLTWACHCRGCQRMTASAFSLSVAIPAEAFALVAGEPVIGGLHGPARHYHCPHCLGWVFTRPEANDRFVAVRAPMVDAPDWTTPFVDMFTSEKLPWVTTPAVHRFAGFPPLDAYAGLIAAYRDRRTD